MSEDNLELWDRYGEHLIPVMPFMDNVIARSEGSYLIDVEGNRILDLAAGQFCNIIGHNHPVFVEDLIAELRNNLHTGSQYVTTRVLETAKEVAEITPEGLDNVILLSTGSEANEFAMRVAKSCTNRTGIVGFDRGYYGISLATRALSALSDGKVEYGPRPPDSGRIIAPNCLRCPLQLSYPECELACFDLTTRLIGNGAENVAAIIVETIVSAGGMLYPTPEYFKALRAFADEIGALLIVDEAQTGFGRCGTWFDCENLDLKPDILVFSKTSGNGYPSSGVVISSATKEKLLNRGFSHLSSHQNDPVTAAAVASVIKIIREGNLLEKSRHDGAYFLRKLEELRDRHQHLGNVRGRGLMIACELIRDPGTREPYREMLTPFVLACKSRGVHLTFTYYEGVIRILPPINISREDIDRAIAVFDETLEDLEQGRLRPEDHAQKNKVIRSLKRSRIKQTLARVWETSPEYWVRKLRG